MIFTILFWLAASLVDSTYQTPKQELSEYCWGQCGNPQIFAFYESVVEGVDLKVVECTTPPNCTCTVPVQLRSTDSHSYDLANREWRCQVDDCSQYDFYSFSKGSSKYCRACAMNCSNSFTSCIINDGMCQFSDRCSAKEMCTRWKAARTSPPVVSTRTPTNTPTLAPVPVPTETLTHPSTKSFENSTEFNTYFSTASSSNYVTETLTYFSTTITDYFTSSTMSTNENTNTLTPTCSPTHSPTELPTDLPTESPTDVPTESPTESPLDESQSSTENQPFLVSNANKKSTTFYTYVMMLLMV
jgi:hypothetical protein